MLAGGPARVSLTTTAGDLNVTSLVTSGGAMNVNAAGALNVNGAGLRDAGLLSSGAHVEVTAGAQGANFILLAGKPLREPMVQYGPFVMNTREEIEQAIDDYQSGRFAKGEIGRIKAHA